MDISSNKQAKSLMAKKRKPLEGNKNSSVSSIKLRHKDYVKERIDQTQQNSKRRLCGDRDEMNYHIISEWSKLAQKQYNTSNDWVRKVIY